MNATLRSAVPILVMLAGSHLYGQTTTLPNSRPNILFIILDDVGKDLLTTFNPAATTSALTPVLNALVGKGLKFMNFYTMPECSPSRAAFFTGRYGFRTGVNAAVLNLDLPGAQVSPYEMTTPKVLATGGYRSAMFGKYHLGGPENNPDGNGAPVALGWDLFNGNMRGGPAGADVTIGGQYTKDRTKYSCGFPTGAAKGVAWFLGSDNTARCDDNQGAGYTGQQAVTKEGIPALDSKGEFAANCRVAGDAPDFTIPNAYYVWPQVIATSSQAQSARSRQYMTAAQTDAAIDWINAQTKGPDRPRPWMATVSYNAIHTPLQQPPTDLYPPGFVWPANVPEDCSSSAAQRILSQLMLASVDKEIGRLLVSTGLAQLDRGQFTYTPQAGNTMIVVVGDNGSFLSTVLAPYDPLRSKGTPYETGVTAPLIVAGPLVENPGRTVNQMVNAVDLFQFFGEMAGVSVRNVVPHSHQLDSISMMPYLTGANQTSLREYNFTHLGSGLKPASVKLWPCVVSFGSVNIATDILFTSQSVCEDNAGKWFGPTTAQPTPQYPTSCSIQAAGLYKSLTISPERVWALRNAKYKLVKVDRPSCEAALGQYELYDLTPTQANPAGLDLSTTNLLTNGQPVNLTSEQMTNFIQLTTEMEALLASEPACPGDGNLDKRVDVNDLLGLFRYLGQPSVFDFNVDGVTDLSDVQMVLTNFGNRCTQRGGGRPR